MYLTCSATSALNCRVLENIESCLIVVIEPPIPARYTQQQELHKWISSVWFHALATEVFFINDYSEHNRTIRGRQSMEARSGTQKRRMCRLQVIKVESPGHEKASRRDV